MLPSLYKQSLPPSPDLNLSVTHQPHIQSVLRRAANIWLSWVAAFFPVDFRLVSAVCFLWLDTPTPGFCWSEGSRWRASLPVGSISVIRPPNTPTVGGRHTPVRSQHRGEQARQSTE